MASRYSQPTGSGYWIHEDGDGSWVTSEVDERNFRFDHTFASKWEAEKYVVDFYIRWTSNYWVDTYANKLQHLGQHGPLQAPLGAACPGRLLQPLARNMNRLWPSKLLTPDLKLGVPVETGIAALSKIGPITSEPADQGQTEYRVELEQYKMAIYERAGKITSIWYDDPAGRSNLFGKHKKIALYLRRHKENGSWNMRIDNGWIKHYYNDVDSLVMAYGIDRDVLTFHLLPQRNAEDQPVAPGPWGPENITAEILSDNVYLKIGKYLYLEQKNPGEQGWTMKKIQIPESWQVSPLFFEGENLILKVQDKGIFRISASNVTGLSSAVWVAREGKKLGDQKLEAIWEEHAKDLHG